MFERARRESRRVLGVLAKSNGSLPQLGLHPEIALGITERARTFKKPDNKPSEEAQQAAIKTWDRLESQPGFNERVSGGIEQLDQGERIIFEE